MLVLGSRCVFRRLIELSMVGEASAVCGNVLARDAEDGMTLEGCLGPSMLGALPGQEDATPAALVLC